jgi:outer membrane protein TolC
LRYIRLKRLAPYDIKDSYVRCDTALAVHENLKKAFYTAKVNYYLQRRDYTRSLVSNLDVLAAIQTLQDSQRNYIRAIYEAKRLYWQLRVSVGEGIEEALNDTV